MYLKLRNDELHLDPTDLKILQALQEDSSQTYAAIGKKLEIAHSTVHDRIKRLERHEVIKGYTALVDTGKFGAKNVTAIMTVYTEPRETEKVAEKLAKSSETLEVYTSFSEELSVMAKVTAPNQESLHAFIANEVAPLPGVLRIRTSVVTRKVKETRLLISNDSTGTFIK